MGLFRFLGILFLVYVVYYLIRNLLSILSRKRPRPGDPNVAQDSVHKKRKIISKEEGEYVDFEEVD